MTRGVGVVVSFDLYLDMTIWLQQCNGFKLHTAEQFVPIIP